MAFRPGSVKVPYAPLNCGDALDRTHSHRTPRNWHGTATPEDHSNVISPEPRRGRSSRPCTPSRRTEDLTHCERPRPRPRVPFAQPADYALRLVHRFPGRRKCRSAVYARLLFGTDVLSPGRDLGGERSQVLRGQPRGHVRYPAKPEGLGSDEEVTGPEVGILIGPVFGIGAEQSPPASVGWRRAVRRQVCDCGVA